jgi:hypothetical protein
MTLVFINNDSPKKKVDLYSNSFYGRLMILRRFNTVTSGVSLETTPYTTGEARRRKAGTIKDTAIVYHEGTA